MALAPVEAQAASEIVLHNFAPNPPKGAYPVAGVIRDSAGNLYGTTVQGGTANLGVVYKVDTTGRATVLYTFTGGVDGNNPSAGVIGDSAGNLYGTASGGPSGFGGPGVVFKVDTAGRETVLYTFTGGTDGRNPLAGVIRDSAGNLYGTTVSGGIPENGTIFGGVVYKLDSAGNETVLHSFTGGADGGNPYAGVIRDSAGNLYGTTYQGGVSGAGVVYKLDAAGQETVLYSFTGRFDGGNPYAGVIRDSASNLYGTTYSGGTAGFGVVYKLDASGHETVLYNFTGGDNGGNPGAGVIRDSSGDLYGTAQGGGTTDAVVVYKLDTAGHETVLYTFMGGSVGPPVTAGVIRDSEGNLYGTIPEGGTAGLGAVYELDATGNETTLYNFPSATDGGLPSSGVVRDAAGNLYGTASGISSIEGTGGWGIVYKVSPAGQETVLHSFSGGADGCNASVWFSIGGLILDSAGNLYGTTPFGGLVPGPQGAGVVYKVDPAGQETVLYSFTGGVDGGVPYGGVIRDSTGNLYGTTALGGAAGQGVVYKLDPSGNETVLHSFTGGADGGFPMAGVIRDSRGNLYGTTYEGGLSGPCAGSPYSDGCGVVYKLDPAGQETVLYTFTGGADGAYPPAGVVGDSAGNLYGTTTYGGTGEGGLSVEGFGLVYKLDPGGQETVLYSFTGGADGSNPYAGVIRDSAGNLYGTAVGGGSAGWGVVYKLDRAGQETVLYNFTGGADGGDPLAGVIRDAAGNLYGTTHAGGKKYGGVIFKIRPQ
jgi:uncharacterized repeat protein (TIGR03803 family)